MKFAFVVVFLCISFIFAQEQVRIQYTGQLNTFSILWQAPNSTNVKPPLVKFGYTDNALTETAKGTHLSYTACLGVYKSVVKEVLITAQPDRTVFFQVSNECGDLAAKCTFSKTYSFRSTPAGTHDFSFVTYGDTNTREVSRTIINLVKRENPRFVLHSGDYAYDQAWSQELWDAWGRFYEPLTSAVPYVTVVGNHEWNCLFRFENYAARFSNQLAKNSGGNGNFWYNFIYSHVHFFVLSSEHPIDAGSVQYKWFETELQKVDRRRTPWVIVSLHQPAYSSLKSRFPGNTLMRVIEPLFIRSGVDLVLAGHDHDYEATCNVLEGKCGRGPIWIVAGTGGTGLYGPFVEPKPEWIRYRESVHGFVKLDVTDKIIRWKFVRANDTIADEFLIRKN